MLIIYEYNNCKEFFKENLYNEDINNPFIGSSVNHDSYISIEDIFKSNNFISDEIKKETIQKGKVQTIFLNASNKYEFDFSQFDIEDDLLVNLYPLDCQIEILSSSGIIKQISNYEYNAFSIFIKKNIINSAKFQIQPLINQLEEKNKKRTYHLIINNIDIGNSQLTFNDEKFPTLIYFDSNLENIILSYNSINSKEPVVFSFFIKEKVRFSASISNSKISNKIIDYKDNIIIDPKNYQNNNNILILINNLDKKDCSMIVKVSGNSSPFYLEKNNLNLGFMPINVLNQSYYMEIFKGEEGEIMLHNKFHNGYLLYRIINNIDETNILKNYNYYFSKSDDKKIILSSQYNNFTKKFNFYSNQTKYCENGCYLLITYYTSEIKLADITGIEYNLLARIWDEDEFKSQIVNIPLNEYIFGAIELSSINAHYYSAYIPENNDIIFELHGKNIKALAKNGILQINIYKDTNNLINLTYNLADEEIENEELMIKLNRKNLGLQNSENQYLSFAFGRINDDYYSKSIQNYYYFRIFEEISINKYTIYPLDTNKVNFCQTTKLEDNNYVCYFILKNDYKQLNNNFTIYAYGNEEANCYNAWPISYSDYNLMDINNIKKKYNNKKQFRERKGYFKVYFENEIFDFILLEIHSKDEETLKVFFNFYGHLIPSPSLDIYSYQSFYLEKNAAKVFNFSNSFPQDEYALFINNTSGDGYICFNDNCNEKIHISEKIFLSFTIPEIKSIFFYSNNNLFFLLKMQKKMDNKYKKEINFGHSYINITNYSKLYFVKDIYANGVDINFAFKFNDSDSYENNIGIYGYRVNYDELNYIDEQTNLEDLLNNTNLIEGKYDPCTKSGLITFDNYRSKVETLKKNVYYIFKIYHNLINSRVFAEIFIDPKNESLFILQKNKYIRGAFNILNEDIQSKTFFIQFKDIEENNNVSINNNYILEFSSNLEDIKPVFNDDFNYSSHKKIGANHYYYFSINNLKEGIKYNFTIQLNNTIKSIFKSKESMKSINFYLANYILKLYKEENDLKLGFIDKSLEYKKINNTSSYNFTIKNNEENFNLSNEFNYTYTYFIRIYLKESVFQPQILNSTAFIFYMEYDKNRYITGNPNEEFSFLSSFINDEKEYILFVFIIVSDNDNQDQYYSQSFYVNKKNEEVEEKEDKKKDNHILIIIILVITFGCVFIITLVISIIVCTIFKNKNKNLKEVVQAISFSHGIDEDKINKKKSKLSKQDEDYESTFI